MFSRLSTAVAISSFALLAVATPANVARQISQCNTGSLSCCNSVQAADSSAVTTLLGLLGVVLGDLTGSVGLNCSPITAVGTGSGATCTQEPVCCTNDYYNGLINVGCSPVNLNL
ncbi:fungal hydrophobin-domain-containing protein [Hygrophoropsis aurantiaca]|uniref:Fungal hydrophobin-domain-containing protein n=1 Tax=Hygrophoropsis aurantiaca TaxID=72124 RepID=A0ACB8A1A0_9AGAM|nr:fungal hydrophobin-domain-containing protein [Hygrophoropsis aurantiaca]